MHSVGADGGRGELCLLQEGGGGAGDFCPGILTARGGDRGAAAAARFGKRALQLQRQNHFGKSGARLIFDAWAN